MVFVTYSDGTPGRYFAYDKSAGWSGANTQMTLKGRLSTHIRYLSPGNASNIYGYDVMGRVHMQYSSQPSGCVNPAYNKQVSYGYNLAGMLTSESDGAGDTYSYTRLPAGMSALKKRIWRTIAIALMVPALAVWVYSGTIWNRYLRTLPRAPDQTTGRIYPRNIHGIVVFQTHAEQRSLDLTQDISIGAFFLGLLIGALEEKNCKGTACQ